MNELGLPPHGREPAFAADEDAYASVVGRALSRRRVRGVATTSITGVAAVAAVLALSAGATTGRAIVEPAAPAAPAAPTPAAPSASRDGSPSLPPDLVVGSLGPEAVVVVPEPLTPRPPYPAGDPTAVPRDRPRPEWDERVATVADRPDAECDTVEPTDAWCYRYVGPDRLVAGEDTTFVAELCRRPGRGPNRVDLSHERELTVMLAGDGGVVAVSPAGARRAHSRTVAEGSCLRWSKTWNGIGDDGTRPPPGTYEVFVAIAGHTPHDPLPNAGSQEDETSYLYRGELEVVR